MEDRELRERLAWMGIDEHTVGVVALLPLVQVAWADGAVQPQERGVILGIADERFSLDAEARHLLESWLTHQPTAAYLETGRALMVELAQRSAGPRLPPQTLGEAVDQARDVARAAGGLFGIGTVAASEKAALEQIAELLHVDVERAQRASEANFFEEDADDEDTDIGYFAVEPHEADPHDPDVSFRPHGEADEACLVLSYGQQTVSYPLREGGLLLGRGRHCDVQIRHDGRVSRQHCRIREDERGYLIEDLESSNGTTVNGERVTRRRLYGDEQIGVGDAEFTFVTAGLRRPVVSPDAPTEHDLDH
jgi:uncharacterized tellurite resistance protein B-like protein